MEASDLKKMRDLDEENRQLKRMFVDLSLGNRALKDFLKKSPGAGSQKSGRFVSLKRAQFK